MPNSRVTLKKTVMLRFRCRTVGLSISLMFLLVIFLSSAHLVACLFSAAIRTGDRLCLRISNHAFRLVFVRKSFTLLCSQHEAGKQRTQLEIPVFENGSVGF